MQTKRTAHAWADLLQTPVGLRAHARKLIDKFGQSYYDDWAEVHAGETKWAKSLLSQGGFSCLDTETTGVDAVAEMSEIGITDHKGETIYQSLVKPTSSVKSAAAAITGIDDKKLRESLTLLEQRDAIQKALVAKPLMLIYNAEFDVRVIQQSAFHAGLDEFELPRIDDVMLHFSRWVGEWNPRQDDYAWHRLEGGHRAVGDCQCMIALVQKMARNKVTFKTWKTTN